MAKKKNGPTGKREVLRRMTDAQGPGGKQLVIPLIQPAEHERAKKEAQERGSKRCDNWWGRSDGVSKLVAEKSGRKGNGTLYNDSSRSADTIADQYGGKNDKLMQEKKRG